MIARASLVLALVLWMPSAVCALDASPWDRVLRAHARGGGFDYAGLARDEARRAELRAFLDGVATMREDEPLGAWLDAYNAIVVARIVERWPLESVQRVPGFFDRLTTRVAGRERTLDEIEHRIIRERFRDARVHAALVCGARSCPALHDRSFHADAAHLDATLDRLVRAWLGSERHLRVEGARISGSAILGWYRADFERDGRGSVLAWLRRYVPERVRGVPEGTAIGELPYDWAVNAAQ